MNKILSLLLFFSITIASTAQNAETFEPCGTDELSPEQQAFLKDFQQNKSLYAQRSSGVTIYIPVKIHLVADDYGKGRYTGKEALEMLCDLNSQFAPYDIQFFIDGGFNYINNSAYFVHGWQDGHSMMVNNNVSGKLNMYFVADPSGACGYYSYGGDAVAIAKGCAGPGNTTVAHEVGHYLSLPHTFSGWENKKFNDNPPSPADQERVDGTNCAYAGDGFCDTPPDYVSYRWNCPYSGIILTDPNGDTVIPDPTYYMSYSTDACQDKFSNDQVLAMKGFISTNRGYLITPNPPSPAAINTPTPISPLTGTVTPYFNNVELIWSKVPNAAYYHVIVSRISTLVLPIIDTIVTDTSFIANNLDDQTNYKWAVKAFTSGYTCSPYTAIQNITTGTGALSASEPLVEGFEFEIYPNPVRASEALRTTISSSESGDGSFEIYSIAGALLSKRNLTYTAGRNNEIIDISNLSAGVYILKFNSEKGIISRKFMVAN